MALHAIRLGIDTVVGDRCPIACLRVLPILPCIEQFHQMIGHARCYPGASIFPLGTAQWLVGDSHPFANRNMTQRRLADGLRDVAGEFWLLWCQSKQLRLDCVLFCNSQ